MNTYIATTVLTQFVEAKGIRFAYRRWGKQSGLPLVFNQHFTGNLDNWDPAFSTGSPRGARSSSSIMLVSRVRPAKCHRHLQAWRRMLKRSSMPSD